MVKLIAKKEQNMTAKTTLSAIVVMALSLHLTACVGGAYEPGE